MTFEQRMCRNLKVSLLAIRNIKFLSLFNRNCHKTNNCWIWKGAVSPQGYGRILFDNHHLMAHRISYLLSGKIIPVGKILDHICRQRNCVNPGHLRVVSQKENVLSGFGLSAINANKTHCKRGHILSIDNLDKYSLKEGRRCCKKCRNKNQIRYAAKKKEVSHGCK